MTPKLKRGLKHYNPDPNIQKVVIVGCGKSGTFYTARYFGKFGFKIGHEYMHQNGICSWYEVSDQRSKDIKEYYRGHKCLYVHLVRHPLKVIASLWRPEVINGKHGLEFFHINCPEYDCLKDYNYVAKHWIVWNQKIEENFNDVSPVLLQVELANKPAVIAYFCSLLGVDYTQSIVDRIQGMHTNMHSKEIKEKKLVKGQGLKIVEPEDIPDHLDPVILTELKTLAKRYGYEL